MDINFYLPKPKQSKSNIMISVNWYPSRINRIRVSTGISIDPEIWNKKKNRVKGVNQTSRNINDKLSEIEKCISDNFAIIEKESGSVNKNKFKEVILNCINPKTNKELKTVIQYLDLFIQKNSEDRTLRTIKTYQTTKRYFQEFQSKQGYNYNLEDVNNELLEDFKRFLINSNHNFSNVTTAKHLRIFKTFLHWTLKKGYHKNTDFINFRIEFKGQKDGINIALTIEELNQLEDYIPDSDRLRKTKDLFLIQCYTGLRYSDLENLKPENFDMKNNIIKCYTLKTTEIVEIPIHNKLMNILKKYPDLNFNVISNQKYNYAIKDLCELAKIDTPIQTVKYTGNKRIEDVKPKYKMISSHTGRRTFITVSLQLGLPNGVLPEDIMKISGHKTRDSFQKYVKIAKDQAINKVRNIWDQ
jgi:integrase